MSVKYRHSQFSLYWTDIGWFQFDLLITLWPLLALANSLRNCNTSSVCNVALSFLSTNWIVSVAEFLKHTCEEFWSNKSLETFLHTESHITMCTVICLWLFASNYNFFAKVISCAAKSWRHENFGYGSIPLDKTQNMYPSIWNCFLRFRIFVIQL
jgi:hypothetical protein